LKKRLFKKKGFFNQFLGVVKNTWNLVTQKRRKELRKLEKEVAKDEREHEKVVEKIKEQEKELEKKADKIHSQIEKEKRSAKRQLDAQIATIQRSTKTSIKQLAPIHNYLRTKSKLYYTWHLNPYSDYLHFLGILIFVGVAALSMKMIYGPMFDKALASNATCTWTGADATSPTDWDIDANWSCGGTSRIPDSDDAIQFTNTYNKPLTMTSNKTVARVESTGNYSSTFNTNYYNLTVAQSGASTFDPDLIWQSGTLTFSGTSEVTVTGDFEISGSPTFNYNTSTLILSGANDTTLNINKDLYNLTIDKTNSTNTVTLTTNDATVTGDFSLSSGTLNTTTTEKVNITADEKTYYIGANSGGGSATVELSFAGDSQYIIASGGTATTNTTITGSGNTYWDGSASIKNLNHNEGTLTIRSGKIIVPNDSGTGKIACAAGQTLNFDGNNQGTSLVILRSDSAGDQWDLDKNATCTVTADWVDIQDSNNTDSGSGDIVTTNSIDSGNNIGWDFTTNGELANTNYWTNTGADNSWDTDTNWSEGHKPAADEYAMFTSDHNDDCNMASTTEPLGIISKDKKFVFWLLLIFPPFHKIPIL